MEKSKIVGKFKIPDKLAAPIEILRSILVDLSPRKDTFYMSGGYVRDTLLNIESEDVDTMMHSSVFEEFKRKLLTVEGVLNYNYSTMSKQNGDGLDLLRFELRGFEFDVKRTEYDNILEVVKSKDFTVNTVLVDLFTLDIIDPNNHMADVNNRVLRGVDKYSIIFIDKNRILRAVRLKHKGFAFEPELERFMSNEAVEYMKTMGTESKLKLGGEIRKIFSKKESNEILKELINRSLLLFISKDKEMLLNSIAYVDAMKDILKSSLWKKVLAKYALQASLEDKEDCLVFLGYVYYFYKLKEDHGKEKPYKQLCKCFFKPKSVVEVKNKLKSILNICQSATESERQQKIRAFVSEYQTNRPWDVILTALDGSIESIEAALFNNM